MLVSTTYLDRLKLNLKLSYIYSFLTGLIFVIPIWVSFSTRVLDFKQITLFSAIGYGFTTFLELPTGALADLLGRKKTIFLGWLTVGLATIFLGYANSILDFLLAELTIAFGAALVSGANTALIFDSMKELGQEKNFPEFVAKTGFVHRMGLAIGTFFGGYLYQAWIGLPYFSQGLVRLTVAALVLLMIEPKIDSEKFSLNSYIKQTKKGFKQLFNSSYMIKLTIFYTFVGGISWSGIYYFNQPFATDIGFSEIEQSWIFSIIYLLTSLLLWLLTKNKKWLTRNRVYLGFPLIMALSYLPGNWASPVLALVILLGVQFVGSARFALLDHYANKEFQSKYRATAISALNMLVSLFYIIIVLAAGPIQDKYNTKLVFTLLGVLSLIVVLPSSLSLVQEYKKYLQKKECRREESNLQENNPTRT